MARRATIIGEATDIWGDEWVVRERRVTSHGFDVLLGWPAGAARGRGGAGGPRVIVTEPLARHFTTHRYASVHLSLPIGASSIKRIRRLMGHHRQIDSAAWWEERAGDLADMTIEAFGAKHGRSAGAVVQARHALFGPTLRPAGWWRAPDVAAILLSDRPRADIADALEVSVGSVGRLRWMLSQTPSKAAPEVRSPGRKPRSTYNKTRQNHDELVKRATQLIEQGVSTVDAAKTLEVTPNTLWLWMRSGKVPRSRYGRTWTPASPEMQKRAIAALGDGVPLARVAADCGVTPQTVHRWVWRHEHGGTSKAPLPGPGRSRVAALLGQGLSQQDIARRTGLSPQRVSQLAKQIRSSKGIQDAPSSKTS